MKFFSTLLLVSATSALKLNEPGQDGPNGPGPNGPGPDEQLGAELFEGIPEECLVEEPGEACAEALGISLDDLNALKDMPDPCAEASNED